MLSKKPEDRPDAATLGAVLSGVASQRDRPGGQGYWTESPHGPGSLIGDSPQSYAEPIRPPQRQPARPPASVPLVPQPRLSELAGLPALTQAQIVADMPTDKAASELLALSRHDAAKIINRCDDALGGNLLSIIAVPGRPPAGAEKPAEEPTTARKILQMLPTDRRGALIDHMNSIALAAVLALPAAEDTVRIVDRADIATVVGALYEMPASRAAPLVLAMDTNRAAEVLRRVGPARAADILRSISSPSQRQQLLARLPHRSQTSVGLYLGG
jgi:hypothetical protein